MATTQIKDAVTVDEIMAQPGGSSFEQDTQADIAKMVEGWQAKVSSRENQQPQPAPEPPPVQQPAPAQPPSPVPATPPTPAPAPSPAPEKAKDPLSFQLRPPATPEQPAQPGKDIPIPDAIKSEKAADHFRTLAQEKTSAIERALALEAELSELKKRSSETETKQLEALRKQNEDLSRRLQVLDVTQHPKFQEYFNTKQQGIERQLKAVAGEELARQILKLAGDPESNGQIESAIEELSPVKQSQIGTLVMRLSELNQERQDAITQAGATREQWVDQQKAEFDKRQQAHLQLFSKTLTDAQSQDRGLEVMLPRDGDEAWNTEVKQRAELARELFMGEPDAETLARASIWAAAAPKLNEIVLTQAALIKKLEAQIRTGQSASPSLTSHEGMPQPPTPPSPGGWVNEVLERMKPA